jgi:asparagine synthase (glutamine-hydrolysing)
MMSGALQAGHTKTFTIGFSDRSFDESKYAAHVSAYFHTDHYERILNPDIMIQMIPEILNFLDEPFADASIIPTYLLSKFTRQHVTVALGGDGGDELFAGYDTFPAHKLACVYNRIPYWIRKYVIEKIIYNLPVSLDNMSFDFKLKQFLKGIPYSPELRNQVWLGSFAPSEHNQLFREEILKETEGSDIFESITQSLKACNAQHYLDQIIYLYCKFYLQDDILTKVDRASMANSLEVRAPLLDYRFVEYTFGLPTHLKLRGVGTKYVFKRVMNRHLPPGIARRAKKGFGIPIAKWIRSDLKELFEEELSERKIAQEGILNPLYVRKLLDEHLKGAKDNRKQLWAILIFELWYKRWFLGK